MGITIYDDDLVLLCDVHIIFVTKYKAKFWSLVTYDEDKHLVIECYHSMTKLTSVTRKRSQMIIFLLVVVGPISALGFKSTTLAQLMARYATMDPTLISSTSDKTILYLTNFILCNFRPEPSNHQLQNLPMLHLLV
jgi:hypothetical protein